MWRRPIVYISGLMILSLLVVQLTVLASTQLVNAGGYPDPFAPYEAIMPGQPTARLEQYPCQFGRVYEREIDPTVCRIHPAKGIFSEVTVHFYADKIWQVVFRAEGLRVGDLVQRWGYPDIDNQAGGVLYIQWPGEVYVVLSPDGGLMRFSYWLPVYAIILTGDEE